MAFGSRIAELIAPNMDRSRSSSAIQKALTEAITLGGLPAPAPAPPPPAQVVPQAPYQPALAPPPQKPPSPTGRNLELVFVHDCRWALFANCRLYADLSVPA